MQQAIDENWVYVHFYVPASFHDIWLSTLKAYQVAWGTEKIFPAIEAMTMEARNALPQHLMD